MALGLLAPPAAASVAVTRTLKLSRPVLEAQGASLERASGPRNFGPGGARRILGILTLIAEATQTKASPSRGGPQLLSLTSAKVIRNVPGCGTPTVSVVNDSFYVTWPTECVYAGDFVVVQFATATERASFNSGQWRDNSDFTVATASGEDWTGVPGIDPRRLAALIAFLAIAGLVVIRRRSFAAARQPS